MNLFDNKLDLTKSITCHSGGADGSDSFFKKISKEYGIKTIDYSYKTKYHNSEDKLEISKDDYLDGRREVNKANKILNRYGISKYMNLLARNWAQVKYSDEIFAIGVILKPGKRGKKGYNTSDYDVVDGGTGFAVAMAINNIKPVYVFDQVLDCWFRWSYTTYSFILIEESPIIHFNNFAGIGTRDIKQNGINAIENLFKKTFEYK